MTRICPAKPATRRPATDPAVQQPSLVSHLRRRYDHAGRQLFEDADAFFALSQIFRDMLVDPTMTGASLIVDALDECQTGLTGLLDLITQTASVPSTCVKWVVSSRYRDDIEQRTYSRMG